MLSVDEIRNYWEDRASGDSSAQSTTQDVYLREIELRVLTENILRLKPARVVDIGCGDGRTTIGVARHLPEHNFFGIDYSNAMIENARRNLNEHCVSNVIFQSHDIRDPLADSFDLAYTTRCLINLPDRDLQLLALRNIYQALRVGGHYLMIENFREGHEKFNQVRKNFGLPEIAIRNHNLFFSRDQFLRDIEDFFVVKEEVNISSAYYLMTRVVYSRICADSGLQPDYFNEQHRYASELPFAGEFGPVRLLILEKK
jgi:SAM-dependent methyltransferase